MTEPAGTPDTLSSQSRTRLRSISLELMKMHKRLLDRAKLDYEARHGKISSVNIYFQLVIDDPHFAWLRKISSLIALLDEATSLRRPAGEEEAAGLLSEAHRLLDFGDDDEGFNRTFRIALDRDKQALRHQEEALRLISE